jgi:hypothetical protein
MGGHGSAVGLADVADLVGVLFPSGAACARERLVFAEQVREAGAAMDTEPSRPGAPTSSREPVTIDAHAEPKNLRFFRPRAAMGLTGLLAAFAVGAVISAFAPFAHGESDPEPEPATVSPTCVGAPSVFNPRATSDAATAARRAALP